jgi:uridine kinase
MPSSARDDDAALLARIAPIARLGAQAGTLIDALDQIAVPADTAIVREGEDGEYMYFVLEGAAVVRRREMEIKRLGPGDYFGELSLLGLKPRAASVCATTTMRLARLSRAHFATLSTQHPGVALHFLEGVVAALGEELTAMTDNVNVLLRERSLPRRAKLRLRVGQEIREVATGTTPLALLPAEIDGATVVGALVDQKPVPLTTPLAHDAAVDAITIATTEGREIYRRSVALLVLEAANLVAPRAITRLGPHLDVGQVARVTGEPGFDAKEFAERLLRAVKRLIANDVTLREETWTVEEARSYFRERGWNDAASLLLSRRGATLRMVSCGEVYALREGPVVPRASMLAPPTITPHPEGLLIDYGETIRAYLPRDAHGVRADPLAYELTTPRFGGEMAREQAHWLGEMGVDSVGAFNDSCVTGKVGQLIRVAEGFHEKRIGTVADRIAARGGRARVIAIAGPSSSGKTTFIKRLTVQLEVNGLHPVNLSLDDYYVDRERTPREPNGEYDFEALEAIDLVLLQNHLGRLLAGETVKTAKFDFKKGKSMPDGGPELRLGPGDVLLIEGIHGLNPALYGDAVRREEAFFVFVHPATTLAIDRLTAVSPADVRLLRRIVRDRHHRGYKAHENIARWPSVRRGEMLHIYPYLPNADAVFDTSLVYELSVLKVYADRYLLEVPLGHPSYSTAYRLRRLCDRFVTIYPDHVPPTSILREFIGGSGFEY